MGGCLHSAIRLRKEGITGDAVTRLFGETPEGVESKDFDVGFVVGSGDIERDDESLLRSPNSVGGIRRGQEALGQRRLLAAARRAMPCDCRFERGAGVLPLPDCPEHSPEMCASECRHSEVASRLGLVDGEPQGGGARVVVAGLALGPPETRDLICLGLAEAELSRGL